MSATFLCFELYFYQKLRRIRKKLDSNLVVLFGQPAQEIDVDFYLLGINMLQKIESKGTEV